MWVNLRFTLEFLDRFRSFLKRSDNIADIVLKSQYTTREDRLHFIKEASLGNNRVRERGSDQDYPLPKQRLRWYYRLIFNRLIKHTGNPLPPLEPVPSNFRFKIFGLQAFPFAVLFPNKSFTKR